MSRFHNPEFTQMELYVAYQDYEWMMNLVEEMVEKIALDLHGKTEVQVGEHVINFQRPWKRYTMYGAIAHYTGIDISGMDEAELRKTARSIGIHVDDTMGRGKLIDEMFGEKVEAHLIQPTFITDYPLEMSPLAKQHRSKPGLVERFEAICNGKEICNAFSELNDPLDQRKRFEDQLELGKRGDEESHAARRRFPARARVRHAAYCRPGYRHRPPEHDHDEQSFDPGRALLPGHAPGEERNAGGGHRSRFELIHHQKKVKRAPSVPFYSRKPLPATRLARRFRIFMLQ